MEIKLSITICTYNRAEYLKNALASLAKQSLAKESYEVVVINNNSSDETESVSLSFEKNNPEINFQYVIERRQGLSFARNRGIEVASGDYIAFIDDDAIANTNYAASIVEALDTYQDFSALGGKVIPFYDAGVELKWLSKYVWGMVAKVDLGEQVKPFTKKYPAGCNMVFRKSIFEEIGLFDTELANRCDDRYIFSQVKKYGLKVLYDPGVKVEHYIPEQRVTEAGIVKLSKLNGSEHRKLLRDSKLKQFAKFVDYVVKLGLSVILSLGFIVKGEPEKTKIVKIMYYSLVGFMSK
jgi:glycosyltransferase involved in cell wall biosynthesis